MQNTGTWCIAGKTTLLTYNSWQLLRLGGGNHFPNILLSPESSNDRPPWENLFKIIPNLKMKYSTVKTVYVPTDKKELRSRFLLKVGEKEDTHDKVAFSVNGHDGLFIEKTDLIEKYIRRRGEINKYAEFKDTDTDCEDLVVAQFAKMMETTKTIKSDEGNEIDPDERGIDEKDLKFHNIMRADVKPTTPLPEYMKL